MDTKRLTHQEGAWEAIWTRRGPLTRLVDQGREVYNFFFRRYLGRYITQEARLLEVGCGTSTLTLSLAGGITELVGVDIAPAALERSRKSARSMGVKNARFEGGDCLDLAYENAFDVVWSQGLMEHFDDPEAVAREHYKAVKKGGIALLSVPYRYSYHALWYLATRPRFLRPLWPWTDQRFYTAQDLLRIGRTITPRARVHFLQPFPLGLAILELPK